MVEDENKHAHQATTARAVVAAGDAASKVEGSSAGGEPGSAVEGLNDKKHERQDEKPLAVSTVECIAPAEQNKMTGKSEPKKRGRPAKRGKGKKKSKASNQEKEKPQKKKAKVSPKAKAKARAKAKAKSNRSKHAEKPKATAEPTVEEETKDRPKKKSKVASKPSSSTEGDVHKDKSKGRKRKVEAEAEEERKEDPSQRTLEELPTVVRTKRIRKKTSDPDFEKPKVPKASPGEEEKGTKSSEAKQRNARKSAAYRRASKAAKDEGKSPEECAAEGRKVFRLSMGNFVYICFGLSFEDL